MKMREVKSKTWSKAAEIKTRAKTVNGIYRQLIKEFDADFFESPEEVADALKAGYIEVCEDGVIVWEQVF